MTEPISEYCVYTIRDGKDLAKIAQSREAMTFEERKTWVTASKLWQKARQAGLAMPVLLGDATDCSRLLFWGLLTNLEGGMVLRALRSTV